MDKLKIANDLLKLSEETQNLSTVDQLLVQHFVFKNYPDSIFAAEAKQKNKLVEILKAIIKWEELTS